MTTATTIEFDPAAPFDVIPEAVCETGATFAELVAVSTWPRVLITAHHASRAKQLATYGSLEAEYWRVHPDENLAEWCRAKLAETPRAVDAMIFAPRGGYLCSIKAAR